MPELPEVEVTARLISDAITGSRIDHVRVTGLGTLRTFDPPISAIEGKKVSGVTRRGKHLILGIEEFSILIHLMSAGRLQLFDKPASRADRTSRLLIGLEDGRELRLREFGTKQSAWARLMKAEDVEKDEAIATLGHEAWPDLLDLKVLLDAPRPLHSQLRDQKVIAGIGRSWVDEILHEAMMSPFKRGSDLTDLEAETLSAAIRKELSAAIDHYTKILSLPIPDKLPMPLTIHRHNSEPCPRCGTVIEAVHFEDHILCYCPTCQTSGKVLKDRRLSRLLK